VSRLRFASILGKGFLGADEATEALPVRKERYGIISMKANVVIDRRCLDLCRDPFGIGYDKSRVTESEEDESELISIVTVPACRSRPQGQRSSTETKSVWNPSFWSDKIAEIAFAQFPFPTCVAAPHA